MTSTFSKFTIAALLASSTLIAGTAQAATKEEITIRSFKNRDDNGASRQSALW